LHDDTRLNEGGGGDGATQVNAEEARRQAFETLLQYYQRAGTQAAQQPPSRQQRAFMQAAAQARASTQQQRPSDIASLDMIEPPSVEAVKDYRQDPVQAVLLSYMHSRYYKGRRLAEKVPEIYSAARGNYDEFLQNPPQVIKDLTAELDAQYVSPELKKEIVADAMPFFSPTIADVACGSCGVRNFVLNESEYALVPLDTDWLQLLCLSDVFFSHGV
jgi:hypothetical protein